MTPYQKKARATFLSQLESAGGTTQTQNAPIQTLRVLERMEADDLITIEHGPQGAKTIRLKPAPTQ